MQVAPWRGAAGTALQEGLLPGTSLLQRHE